MDSSDFASKKALLIEDMAEARIMQKKMLSDFGFRHIEIAMKAETAMELLKTQSFDVILSDYNLGNGKDGQQLLEEVRHSNLIPNTATYLMVTAETSIEMVMGAIEFQPDGYITKPFSQRLLLARIRAVLRRASDNVMTTTGPNIIRQGHLLMDPDRHLCSWKETEVKLTVTEFLILQALAQRPGMVKNRDQLMDAAYGESIFLDDRTIDSHIKRLRRKMRAHDAEFDQIETLYGIGYKYKAN